MGPKQLALAIGTALLGVYETELVAASDRTPNCFEYGYDYTGYDIHQVPSVYSPAMCMEECAGHGGCVFWTYDTISRMCYLKSAGAFTERKPVSMMVSGPRQCTFESTCYEVGIDYYGYDIEKIEGRYVMNPLDCQRLCTGNPQCAFFSWKFSTHSCFLKSASAFLNRREDPDVTSGPRLCSSKGQGPIPPHPSDYPAAFDPSTAPAPCFESAVEYRGYTVGSVKKRSPAACQSECQKQKECHYWTWSSERSICSLKDANALNGRVANQNTVDKVSGAKKCIPVTPGCHFSNVGVVGARLSIRSAASFDVCQIHCASFPGCTHFSYDTNGGNCIMWSSFETYSQGNSTQGLVSGPAVCDFNEVCYEQSDYVGFNVDEDESGEVKSPAACQALCQQNAECHYWTWLRTNKGCYLKDANALQGRANDATSLDRFSGPKFCTVNYGCLSINSVYTGFSFQQSEEKDYEACGAACNASSFCKAWTYHSDLGFCSLFADSVSLSQVSVKGAVSGDKYCIKQDEEEASFFEEGISYDLDNLFRVVEAKSADECYARCKEFPDDCKFWSLKNGEECYLIRSPDQPSFVFEPNSVSGPALFPSNYYFADEVESTGGELDTVKTYTAEGCMRKCEKTKDCLYWDFNENSVENNCKLFDKTATRNKHDWIIGGRVLPPSMVASGCTFSDPIGSVTVGKPMQCQVECQFNELCEAWQTKVETAQGAGAPRVTCTLFQSAGNLLKIQDNSTTCGTKIVPGSILLSSMKRDPGDENEAKNVTLAKCITFCSKRATPAFWTFNIENTCRCIDTATDILLTSISGAIDRGSAIPNVLFNTSYVAPPNTPSATFRLASGFRKKLAAREAGQQVASLNECIKACSEEPTCTSWTFKENTCSMFRVAMIPVKDDNAISGLRSTPQLSWEFELGKKITGDPVLSFPAANSADGTPTEQDPSGAELKDPETAMECAARAEEQQCFSFKAVEGGTSVCYIFDACDVSADEEGFVSGKPQPLSPQATQTPSTSQENQTPPTPQNNQTP